MKTLLIIILLTCSSNVICQTIDDYFVETDGTVYDMDSDSNYVYFAGEFTEVMYYTGGGVIIPKTSMKVNLDVENKISGIVKLAKADGDGGWYISGEFTRIGDQFVRRFAHLYADGSLDTNILPFIDFEFEDFTFDEEYIYLPYNTKGFIKINRITGETTTLITNTSFYSTDYLQVYKDYIYVIGNYQNQNIYFNFGGRFSKFTGIKDEDFKFTPNGINYFTMQNDFICFESGNNTISKINILDPYDTHNWKINHNGINEMKIDGDFLYLSGSFNEINDIKVSNFARINLESNEVDSTWQNSEIEIINNFDFDEEYFYLSSNYDKIFKIKKSNFQIIETYFFNKIYPKRDGLGYKPIYSIAVSKNNLFIGGSFSCIGESFSLNSLFRYNLKNNELDTNFILKDEIKYRIKRINKLKIVNNYLYFFSLLSTFDDDNKCKFSKYDISTKELVNENTLWEYSPSISISDVEADDNFIYAGGYFYKDKKFKNLIRFNLSDISIDENWMPNPNNEIKSLKFDEGKLYVGGYFDSIFNVNINYLARLELNSSQIDTYFNLNFYKNPGNGVLLIETNKNDIFLLGYASSKKNFSINGLSKISKNGLSVTNFNNSTNLFLDDFAINNNDLFFNNNKVNIDNFKLNEFWDTKIKSYQNRLSINIIEDYIYYSGGLNLYYGNSINDYKDTRISIQRFKLNDDKLKTPEIIYPENNSVNLPFQTSLACSKIDKIIDYEFWYSGNKEFTTHKNQSYNTLYYNSKKNIFNLSNKNFDTIYCKVRAISDYKKSEWSKTKSFEYRFLGPEVSVLENEYSPIKIEWEDFGEDFSYFIVGSEDQYFNTRIIDSVPTDVNFYLENDFKDSTTYYLKVYALNNKNNKISDTYNPYFFRTLFKKFPGQVKLNYPINKSKGVDMNNSSFSWNNTRDYEVIVLQVSTDSLFNSYIINNDSIDVKYNPNYKYDSYHTLALDSNTTYYWRVKAKNKLGESEFSDTWKFTTMSSTSNVEDNNDNKYFTIYPNPANSILNIESNNQYINIDKIEILDLNGKSFLKQDVFKSKIDLDIRFLPTGAYLIKIESQNENQTFKFIKN